MRSVRGLAFVSVLSFLFLSQYATAQIAPIIGNHPPANDTTAAGAEYLRTLTLSQGSPPVTWDFDSPPVHPPGAQIDQNGQITGWTPTTADIGFSFDFHVRVTNNTGGNFVTWTVKVGSFNNGFNAQHIFALRNDPSLTNLGKVIEYDEQGHALRDYTNWERWVSLSFSGTGTPAGTNDTRCYTVRAWTGSSSNPNPFPDATPRDGVNIRAFNSGGNVDYQCWVHELAGWLPATDLQVGSIRYSAFHNSLFVGVDRNLNTSDPIVIYELDVPLTQIKNVYTGPNTNVGGQVNLDINSRNGTLYAINQHLGTSAGNLVAFTTTSTFTTLVNGQTFSADGQPNHNQWSLPNCVIYRQGATANDDTLVVFMNNTINALEFWANTASHPVDGNGNLQLKGRFNGPTSGWNGQQAPFDGTIHWGAQLDGFGTIQTNNQLIKFLQGDSNWLDADSPSYPPTVLVPIIFGAPPNPDQTVILFEYIRQLSVTQGAPVTWSLLQAPPGAQIDQTGKIFGWKPSSGFAGNVVPFQVQATNSLTSATASWLVQVQGTRDATSDGFHINYLYAIKNYENPGGASFPPMGKIQVYEKDTMNLVNIAFTNIEGWTSLTFSGLGTNDTRCYTVRPFAIAAFNAGGPYYVPPFDGYSIRNFKADGEQTKELRQLQGAGGGSSVQVGNIRYSPFHNHLFISYQRNDTLGATDTGRATEYTVAPGPNFDPNADLAFVKNYAGPQTRLGGPPNVEINARDGTLYMIGRRQGNDNTSNGPLGDLVSLDTGLVIPPVVTRINGQTFAVSHPEWYLPNAVIYRPGATAAEDTLVIFTDGNGTNPPPVTMEFWADIASHPLDANGNLQFKGFLSGPTRGWKGQLDAFTHDIDYAAMADGFGFLTLQNILHEFAPDDPDWSDAGSPRFPFTPGLCNDPFADVDDDGDVDMDDFAVFQRCYTGPDNPVPTSPDYCQCFDRVGSSVGSPPDDHITESDLVKFAQCASGAGVPANIACDN